VKNYFLTAGLAIISAQSLSLVSATLLTLLALPYKAYAHEWTYLCSGNTQGATCKVDERSPWCFTYCKSNDERVYVGYPTDGCCLSNQKTSQRQDIRNGTSAAREIEAEAPQTDDSSLVPRVCIYDEPCYLPFVSTNHT
jgi:hypothetical protein